MATDENNVARAPKHGRHAAAGRHAAPKTDEGAPAAAAAQPVPAPEPPASELPPATAATAVAAAPITDGDQELQMDGAPVPIGVDPEESGSFSRISASQGARVTTRANASETASFRAQGARPVEAVRMSTAGRPHVDHRETAVETNGRVFAVLGIAAVLMVAVVGWLITRALGSVEQVNDKQVVEQTQTDANEGIEYRGTTYALVEKPEGGYALTSTSEDQEGEAVLCDLKGTPVALILYNTAFIIPENLSDGTWDLVAYHLGGGSVTQQVTDAEGTPIVEQGEISHATLSGDDVVVETTEGASFTISLV